MISVDDMFLVSDIYSPAGTTYQVTPADLTQHVTWAATVNSRLPTGSNWFMEVGHNGNGNIEVWPLSISHEVSLIQRFRILQAPPEARPNVALDQSNMMHRLTLL
jgi:hypothetical protein